MFIYGNLANAHAQSQQKEAEGLVPSFWELIRRRPGGKAEVIATNVLTFDLTRAGSVLCCDGESIVLFDANGRSERVLKGELIEQVLAL